MKKIKFLSLLLAVLLLSGCGVLSDLSQLQQNLQQDGLALQAAGDYEGAIAKYEEALKLANMVVGPEEYDIACYKASAQCQNGDVQGAIDTYSAILALEEDEDTYLGRGILYMKALDAEKAGKDLNKMLKKTNDPLIKGIIWKVIDKTEDAKRCFEKATEEGNVEGLFYLADIYEEAGDSNYAMILLEQYIESGKASAGGYLSVGRNYFDEGEYQDALEKFQEGIQLGESGVLKNLLQEEIACYEKLGDFAMAKERAAVYMEKYPNDEVIQKEYEFLKSR